MKKIILFLTLTISAQSFAQSRKVFLAEDGSAIDSSKATFYLLINQLSDTSWSAKQYGMDNVIITEGNYKDASLITPHGKFTYYNRDLKKIGNEASASYVETVGEYKNGLKDGQWIVFRSENFISSLDTYKNDKLNGLHENYGDKTLPITIRGNYVDDVKEGEWYTISKDGNILRAEGFTHGKRTSDNTKSSGLKAAIPPDDFNSYIIGNITKVVSNDTNETIFVHCTITNEGMVVNPTITNPEINPSLAMTILNTLLKSPKWKPAYDVNLKIYIEWNAGFMVTIKKGNVNTFYSSKAEELIHQIKN
ncbi:hypothetical protein ABIB62_001034 [Mucilaginibacter sp. UYP25]|uniref:toxin-antitoxin system YwqK family antitoxin n=1 Tax=unclassified Mucilaginibacter TaxID=2617802 RepID=UPI0033964147